MLCWSSCGESGTACGKLEAFTREGKCEGEGICSDRPLASTSDRRLDRGVRGRAWSSLLPLPLCSRSRKVGEGWRAFGATGGSEKERVFEGVFDGESAVLGGGRSIVPSIFETGLFRRQWLQYPTVPLREEVAIVKAVLASRC